MSGKNSPVLPEVEIEEGNEAFLRLLTKTLSGIPKETPPIRSVKKMRLRKRASMRGAVGLTIYCCVEYESGKDIRTKERGPSTQTITFYTELLNELSDGAAVAVIAHELAHAWLNEYIKPEQSKRREEEADTLARKWGFERELEALAGETEPFPS